MVGPIKDWLLSISGECQKGVLLIIFSFILLMFSRKYVCLF